VHQAISLKPFHFNKRINGISIRTLRPGTTATDFSRKTAISNKPFQNDGPSSKYLMQECTPKSSKVIPLPPSKLNIQSYQRQRDNSSLSSKNRRTSLSTRKSDIAESGKFSLFSEYLMVNIFSISDPAFNRKWQTHKGKSG